MYSNSCWRIASPIEPRSIFAWMSLCSFAAHACRAEVAGWRGHQQTCSTAQCNNGERSNTQCWHQDAFSRSSIEVVVWDAKSSIESPNTFTLEFITSAKNLPMA